MEYPSAILIGLAAIGLGGTILHAYYSQPERKGSKSSKSWWTGTYDDYKTRKEKAKQRQKNAKFKPTGKDIRKELGKLNLLQFMSAFERAGIKTWDAILQMSKDEIVNFGRKANIPTAAIDHLLNNLKKQKKKPTEISPSKSSSVQTPKKSSSKKDPSKSSYYHFASTPKKDAQKYDAVKVKERANVTKKADGASSWNPGNTFEERDFSDLCKEMFEEGLMQCQFGRTSIREIRKVEMDYSVVSARNKVKYIYDASFQATLKDGSAIVVEDIFPDTDSSDWHVNIGGCDRSRQRAIEDSLTDNINDLMKVIQKEVSQKL